MLGYLYGWKKPIARKRKEKTDRAMNPNNRKMKSWRPTKSLMFRRILCRPRFSATNLLPEPKLGQKNDAVDRGDIYQEEDLLTASINPNDGYGNLESNSNQSSPTYPPAARPIPYQSPRQNYESAPRPNTGYLEYGQPGAYMPHPALRAEN